ncbi:hypothetical protein SAMN02745120_0593 [Acetoanaerobium noterae]|uniref:Uncharacterized protein n=1 Tax=Acetoanaerobium noterae TaxID=745369 RepID=A0A1T5A0J8_9FIRM|nr:hypothetical protein [Acetoanaerobium noterae]SKB28289.1 hypothetical protein SAMN02745120_0593 [Acetoanaerobium noterae]
MPEKLMRWNGSEWVEVTSLVRNEVTTVVGLRKKLEDNLVPITPADVALFVDIDFIRKDLNVNYDVRVSGLTKL